jgi:flavin reductase (DIM6/NTAB) family NADH-FMN oxidoreductase RutF
MIIIDFDHISESDKTKLLIGSIVPRPIAFVTSKSMNGILNGAPFSYFNIVSTEPPLISISIRKEKIHLKDTANNILNLKAFVVHIVSPNYLDQVNQSSFSYPPEVSEITETGLTPVKSLKIPVEGVKEARIRFECLLERAVDLPGSTLIIGKIIAMHVDESVYQDGKILIDQLEPISRLAGSHYATIGEIITKSKP